MRNRGHKCLKCQGTDEAHHRRHTGIAEMLRALYNHCDVEIALAPRDDDDGDDDNKARDGGQRMRPPPNIELLTPKKDEATATKSRKELKLEKSLLKAAARHKVLTAQQIGHVGVVLHSPFDTAVEDESPENDAEIEEIERNLVYNAHVYNTGQKRSILHGVCSIEAANLDFDKEMAKILDTFQVSQLLEKGKKKGDNDKDLLEKVKTIKLAITEELVASKKEEMEVRMRRAGFLRFINRSSFEILEDRHRRIDWATGEKIGDVEGDEMTPGDGMTPDGEDLDVTDKDNIPKTGTPKFDPSQPDLRHLSKKYRSLHASPALVHDGVQHHMTLELRPAISTVVEPDPVNVSETLSTTPMVDALSTPVESTEGEQSLISTASSTTHEIGPIASRKMKKRRRNEAWKERKQAKEALKLATVSEDKVEEVDAEEAVLNEEEVESSTPLPKEEQVNAEGLPITEDVPTAAEEIIPPVGQEVVVFKKDKPVTTEQVSQVPVVPPPVRHIPVHHNSWKNFTNQLLPDTLTDPYLRTSTCPYAQLNQLDCPFHSHSASRNALVKDVLIVYPSNLQPLSSGPYNLIRAKMLLRAFNDTDEAGGRLIIVPTDISAWLLGMPAHRRLCRCCTPPRVAHELGDKGLALSQAMGPCLKIENIYNAMAQQNDLVKEEDRLTPTRIKKIQLSFDNGKQKVSEEDENKDTVNKNTMCYCRGVRMGPYMEGEVVECAGVECKIGLFHSQCVACFGVGVKTRWYCLDCEDDLKKFAKRFVDEEYGTKE
ncbi:hypothetical protein P154DRAFT_527655 [Amniculicola lignicola CBS 123094]|uniref:Zinc finger PHD-type domain-containing protein n=1 Tax=Amniculicola lignicola CBS 123094 TaxID=1392246 RepID=A0A6A5VXH1_9PLEO|nr:hypothetical protein P154DRAFT_527655 [Amniculicola lignicola CBS 123094]